MSSKPSAYATGALQDSPGRASCYGHRGGISSASEAAAMHERNRARNEANRDNSRTPTPSDVDLAQNSSIQGGTNNDCPRVGVSRASDAAKLHDTSRAGSLSRHGAGAFRFSDSAETLVADAKQTNANIAKSKPGPAKTYKPSSSTAGASNSAAKLAEKTMNRAPTVIVPCFPPVFDIEPGPLSPEVLRLASGPCPDILLRLSRLFPESGSFGDSKLRS